MKIKTFIIDAFTNQSFKGNPAGVCLLQTPLEEHTMQAVAAEINAAETAFLLPDPMDETRFSIRYFSPMVEIPFCGHATLASSKLILHKLKREKADFTTHFGLKLTATSQGKKITMQFPLYDTVPYQASQGLLEAVGIQQPINIRYNADIAMMLVEVADLHTLSNLQPDFSEMVANDHTVKEVVVTTRSTNQDFDFYSRCFCPWVGINEDPVTGAIHAVLAKYWGEKLGKTQMKAFQCSARGGFMALKITGPATLEVTSEAQIVLEGWLRC